MRFWGRFKLSGWWRGGKSGAWIFTGLVLGLGLAASLSLLFRSGTAAASTNTLSDTQIARMSSSALAKYVFDNQGCTSCHTVSADGKLGFTERGKAQQVG